MSLGDLEDRVLAALLRDARATADHIGAEADVAADTAADVRRRLEDAGVITGYRPRVDYPALGLEMGAIISVEAADADPTPIRNLLAARRNVLTCYEVTGSTDVIVVARYPSPRALDGAIRRLKADPAVASVSVDTVLDTVAEGEHPPVPPAE
jgi:DNA-binding Lrp family transcriptional regulator